MREKVKEKHRQAPLKSMRFPCGTALPSEILPTLRLDTLYRVRRSSQVEAKGIILGVSQHGAGLYFYHLRAVWP